MGDEMFETLDLQQLAGVHGGCDRGGMDPNARWIMMRESNGNPFAQNPTSSAFGAFQMIKANRKRYMGSNWRSTNLGAQYRAASSYVRDRYGSWAAAKRFWQRNRWY